MPRFFTAISNGVRAFAGGIATACSSAASSVAELAVGAAKATWEGVKNMTRAVIPDVVKRNKLKILSWSFSVSKMVTACLSIFASLPGILDKEKNSWGIIALAATSAIAAFICTHFLYDDFLQDQAEDMQDQTKDGASSTPPKTSWGRWLLSKGLQVGAIVCVMINKASESAILWYMIRDVMAAVGAAMGDIPLVLCFGFEFFIAMFGKIFLNLYNATKNMAQTLEKDPKAQSILKGLVKLFNKSSGLRNVSTSTALVVRTFGEDVAPAWGIPIGFFGKDAITEQNPQLKMWTIVMLALTAFTGPVTATNNFLFDRRQMNNAIQDAAGESLTPDANQPLPRWLARLVIGMVALSPLLLSANETSTAGFSVESVSSYKSITIGICAVDALISFLLYATTEAKEGVEMILERQARPQSDPEIGEEEIFLPGGAKPYPHYGTSINQ